MWDEATGKCWAYQRQSVNDAGYTSSAVIPLENITGVCRLHITHEPPPAPPPYEVCERVQLAPGLHLPNARDRERRIRCGRGSGDDPAGLYSCAYSTNRWRFIKGAAATKIALASAGVAASVGDPAASAGGRRNAQHQTTSILVNKFQSLVIEDLNIKGMMSDLTPKAQADAGMDEIRRQLLYKDECITVMWCLPTRARSALSAGS